MPVQEKLQIILVYIPHGLLILFVIYAFIRPTDFEDKNDN